jgi:peroxiredoxin
MTNTRFLVLTLALAAGCGDASSTAKKNDRQGPFPVQRPNAAPVQPTGGQPAQPVEPDKRTGTVGEVKPNPPPVNPPPVSGNKKGVKPGDDAPELVLEDADGKVFMLSSYRGKKPVLVVFGATWCGTCKANLPGLVDAANTWMPKDVQFAEVFLGEEAAKARPYAQEHGLKYLLVPDPRQLSRTKYGFPVEDMPMHVLVGKDGRVVASGGRVPSAAEFESALK